MQVLKPVATAGDTAASCYLIEFSRVGDFDLTYFDDLAEASAFIQENLRIYGDSFRVLALKWLPATPNWLAVARNLGSVVAYAKPLSLALAELRDAPPAGTGAAYWSRHLEELNTLVGDAIAQLNKIKR